MVTSKEQTFEEWLEKSFSFVKDPVAIALARCAWNARWDAFVKHALEMKNDKSN